MNQNFDVIVLGLGANGSSAIYHLSKTGARVCCINQFTPHIHMVLLTGKVALSARLIMKARFMFRF